MNSVIHDKNIKWMLKIFVWVLVFIFGYMILENNDESNSSGTELEEIWEVESHFSCNKNFSQIPRNISRIKNNWISNSNEIFMYSAYYDFRFKAVVVISIALNEPSGLYCLLWNMHEKHFHVLNATSTFICKDSVKRFVMH